MVYLLKLLVIIVSIFLISLLPLIGAYDYEASLLIALAGVLFVPILTPPLKKGEQHGTLKTLVSAIVYFVLANCVTILAAWIHDELCDIPSGIRYQLLISLPSVLLTSVWWSWTNTISQYKRVRIPLYLFLPVLDIGFTLYALLNWPPIVAFGQFFGFFAGSIYDESIQIIQSLEYYRIGTLFLIICLLLAQQSNIGMVRRLVFPLAGIILAAGYHIFLSQTGVLPPIGRKQFEQALWETVQSPDNSFRVHFMPGTKDRETLQMQKYLMLQNYTKDYKYLESFFKTRPPKDITIWEYPDAQTKGRFIGAIRTSFARVWKYETHLVKGSPDSTLARHEMAHLFAASFGQAPLQVAGAYYFPAIGWIEGLAMAAEWPIQTYNLHVWSNAILQNQETFGDVTLSSLLYGFWGMPSRVAYTLAGSYVRYLIDIYGIEAVKRLSRELPGKFDDIIDVSASDSFENWKKYISQFSVPDAIELAPVVFGSTSIWTKQCARYRAKQESEYYRCLEDMNCSLQQLDAYNEMPLYRGTNHESEDTCDHPSPDLKQLERIYRLYLVRGPIQSEPLSERIVRQIKSQYPMFGTTLNLAISRNVSRSHEASTLSAQSAAENRTSMYKIMESIDWEQLPPAAQLIWLERRADMLWHANMYTAAYWMYRGMIARPLPEQMARRIEIKAQAAHYPESPVSQQIRIWFTTNKPTDRIAIAQQYDQAPVICYLDWIAGYHERDISRMKSAWSHLWLSIGVSDPAATLPPRAWKELFRLVGKM